MARDLAFVHNSYTLRGGWKEKVRQRISRVAQVLVICGEHADTATGVNAELVCVIESTAPLTPGTPSPHGRNSAAPPNPYPGSAQGVSSRRLSLSTFWDHKGVKYRNSAELHTATAGKEIVRAAAVR